MAPDWQVVPQHGLPGVPHPAHIPPVQTNPVEQVVPPQHICVLPPQATQVPALPHTLPAAHDEPPQHGCPAPPQLPQVPAAEHATPLVAAQRWPLQHSWPVAPHAEQIPMTQTASPLHASPAQQGNPGVPHMTGRSPASEPSRSLAPSLTGERSTFRSGARSADDRSTGESAAASIVIAGPRSVSASFWLAWPLSLRDRSGVQEAVRISTASARFR